jgi:hypothetical protein
MLENTEGTIKPHRKNNYLPQKEQLTSHKKNNYLPQKDHDIY